MVPTFLLSKPLLLRASQCSKCIFSVRQNYFKKWGGLGHPTVSTLMSYTTSSHGSNKSTSISTSPSSLPSSSDPLKNEAIPAIPHLIINHEGKSIGIKYPKTVLASLDRSSYVLVQVQSTTSPPICRILSRQAMYQKSKAQTHSKPKSSIVKTIELGVSVSDHDFAIKVRKAKELLQKGYQVDLLVLSKGKQKYAQDTKQELLGNIEAEFAHLCQVTKARATPTKTPKDSKEVRFHLRALATKA